MQHKKKKKIRIIVQLFFFILIGLIAINKTLSESGNAIPFLSQASLHSLCPFGGVATLYTLVTEGSFIQKIHNSSIILMAAIFILTILFGPVFCGWVCPLGSAQEWIGKLGRRIFKNKYNKFVPLKIDKIFRYFRYFVFVWVIYVTARSGQLLFSSIDPYNALFTFWSNEVALPSLIILVITLLFSLFVERPWCKYACPYGALLGLFNKVRVFKIRRNPNNCIQCKECDSVCPMNIEISQKETVTNLSCISCMECTSELTCPETDTVSMQTYKKTKSVQKKGA
ncbi:MAG: 4Fe-4S binding protein [Eubacteriaceae bacterium]|nr:4Fe-4S binding protein [Eubacteriaceae bacterium]